MVWSVRNPKHSNLIIGGSTPPTLGDFSIIPNITKEKPTIHPTKLLQRVHMEIGFGDCVALGEHRYVLRLVDRETRYIWTYCMWVLSGVDVIQALQKISTVCGPTPIKALYWLWQANAPGGGPKMATNQRLQDSGWPIKI